MCHLLQTCQIECQRRTKPPLGGNAVLMYGRAWAALLRVAITRPLVRGLLKKCPHCGRGPIYTGWAREVGRCPACGLVYEKNPGDTWGWVIIGDRIPVAIGIVAIYFRFGSTLGTLPLIFLFGLLIIGLVWTAPNRWGVGIALHYLSRAYWPDPSDPLPPPMESAR